VLSIAHQASPPVAHRFFHIAPHGAQQLVGRRRAGFAALFGGGAVRRVV
jgi:hypothetical protein